MIGNLSLDHLRVLVAIDDTGSFSAAGRQLRRVQSAISHAVQSLGAAQQGHTEVGKHLVARRQGVVQAQADFGVDRAAGLVAGPQDAGFMALHPKVVTGVTAVKPGGPHTGRQRHGAQVHPALGGQAQFLAIAVA